VASSDAATSRGGDRTFATFAAPTVSTDPATSVTPTSARLNGTITSNGQATSWFFEYGTTTSYAPGLPSGTSAPGRAPCA